MLLSLTLPMDKVEYPTPALYLFQVDSHVISLPPPTK